MALIRVNKNNGYTIMSNHHLNDRRLTLKAKGLLSLMFSLPDDWDYSVKGLVSISKEQTKCIEGILAELKETGYLRIVKLYPNQTKSGRFEYVYDIFEYPMDVEKQDPQKQSLEFQPLENGGLNQILNNKVLNNINERKNERVITKKEINKKNNKACACECACEENEKALKEYKEVCDTLAEDIKVNQEEFRQINLAETLKDIGEVVASKISVQVCGKKISSVEVLNTLRKSLESGLNDDLIVRTIREVLEMTVDGKIKGNQEGYLISTLYNRLKLGGSL